MMKELPENWKIGKLSEVADVVSGIGFPKEYQGETSGKYPFYKVGDISRLVQQGEKNLTKAENYVNEEVKNKLRGKPLGKGSIVFAKIGEALKLNRRGIISKTALVDNNVMGVVPSSPEMNMFLYYFLQDFDLGKLSSGNTVPSVRKSSVLNIEVPIPPLPEQKRIVAKLDDLFGHLDSLNARMDRIPDLLKNFRQQVLTQAVTGKLTEEWRVEASLAEGKFESLGALGKVIAGQSPKVSEVNLEGRGEKYITGPEQWDGRNFHKPKWTEFPKKIAPENSIFVTVKGAGVGKTFLGIKAAIGRDIYAFVPDSNENHKYVLYSIQATTLEIISKAKGMIPGLTKAHLQDHIIYHPDRQEQDEIVIRIEKLLNHADRIEDLYKVLNEKINNLPQAILNKAFKGELVPQDPNDEPASELLERIKNEREPKKTTKKRIGKKTSSSVSRQKSETKAKVKKASIKKTESKPAAVSIEENIIQELLKEFGRKQFTFEEIPRRITSNYEELRKALYLALDKKIQVSNKSLKMRLTRETLNFKFESS